MSLNTSFAVQTALVLTNGVLSGGTNLTLGTASAACTLTRNAGSLAAVPTFITYSTSNPLHFTYNGGAAINSGNELPPTTTPTYGTLSILTASTNLTLTSDVYVGSVSIAASTTLTLNSHNLGLGGVATPIANSGTIAEGTAASATITLFGTVSQSAVNFAGTLTGGPFNLTVNNSGGAIATITTTALTVAGLTVQSGGNLNLGALTLSVKNDVSNNGTITTSTANAVLNMNGTVAQNINGSGTEVWTTGTAGRLLNLTINNATGVSLNTSFAVQTALTLTAGALGGTGTLTIGIPATAVTCSRAAGSLTNVPQFNFTIGAYAITYNGTSQTYNVLNELPTAPTPTNGVLSVSGTTNTVILDRNAYIGSLTTSAGNVFSMGTTGYTLGLSSTTAMANSGTFTANGHASNTVLLNGTLAQTFAIGGTYTGTTLPNLTLSNAAGASFSTSSTIPGVLNLSSGALTITGTQTLTGTVTGSGTLTSASAVLVLGGSNGSMGTINLTGGAATLASLTMNRTGTNPSVTINGNLTIAAYTLTSGVVNMGNSILIHTGNNTTMPSTAGSAASYFAFLGSTGGFQWNMPANTVVGTYRWPVGPAGNISGFRPVSIKTNGVNPASIVNVKVGFINHDGTSVYSPTNVVSSDNRAGFIVNITSSATQSATAADITLSYQNTDFNNATPTTASIWKHSGNWANMGAVTTGAADGNITITKTSAFSIIAGTYPLIPSETINDNTPASTWTWLGGTSIAWGTATNWSPASVPTNATTSNILINNPTAAFQPTLSSAAVTNVNDITVGTGCTLTVSSANTNLTINGNFNYLGNVVPSTGTTITYAGSGTQTIQPINYYTLVSSGTGARILSPTGTISVATAFTVGTNAYTTTNSTVNFNGAATVSLLPGSAHYYNLAVSTTAALGGATFVDNNLTLGTGVTLTDAAYLLSGPGTGSGTFTMNGTAIFTMTNASTTTGTNNACSFPIFSSYSFNAASKVNYNGAATQTIYAIASPGYGNLSTTTGSTTYAKTATGSFIVQGTLTVASTTSAFFDGGFTITVNGNVNNGGAICGTGLAVAGSGKIVMSSSNAQTILGAGTQYGNLEFNNSNVSGVAFSGSASALLNVYGNINITAGLVYMGNFTTGVTVAGTTTVGDGTNASTLTFNGATGTKTLTGDVTVSANATLNATAVAALVTFKGNIVNNGTFNPVLSTGAFTLAGVSKTLSGNPYSFNLLTVSASAAITVNSGVTVNIAAASTVDGALTNNGSIYSTYTTATVGGAGTITNNNILSVANTGFTCTLVPAATANTIIYAGAASQNVKVPSTNPYYNLTINKSANTATLSGALTVSGDLTIENGTLADNNNQLSGPGASSGKTFAINNSGQFTTTNVVTSITTAYIGGMPIFQYNAFSLGSTVYYNAAAASPVAALTYGNLSLGNNSSATNAYTKTAQGSVTVNGNYNFTAGYAGCVFMIGNNNTLTINGTITQSNAVINGYAGPTSNIVLGGTAGVSLPTIASTIKDLTINKTSGGIVTMAGAQTVAGVLYMTEGILNVASLTLTLTGTVNSTNATLSSGGTGVLAIAGTAGGDLGTINLTGGAQTFNSLSFSRSGVTPSATINGNLTLANTGAAVFSHTSAAGVLNINGNLTLTGLSGGMTMNTAGGVLNMNGNLSLNGTSATFALTNGIVNMGNNLATYAGPVASMSSTAGNATSYFSFLGNAGGFQWNMPASTVAGTYRFPVGPSGDISGFRPISFQTLSANPASVISVKANFINHTVNGTVSGTEIPLTGNNRAGYIANITVSGGTLPVSNLTMAYQDADFNGGAPTVTTVAIYRYNGVDWDRVGYTSNSTANGNTTIVKNSVSVLTSSQPYALGVTGGTDLQGNTFKWEGATSSAWNDPTNWDLNNGAYPNDPVDVVVIDNTYSPVNWPVIPSSVVYNVKDITVGTGASLTIGGGTLGELDVWNNFTNAGNVTGTVNSTVKFMSASSQTIPEANYYNLTCNGGAGARSFSTTGTIGVAGVLTLGTNTYTTAGSTIEFNGTAAQFIPLQPTTGFYQNVIISNASTKSLAAVTTINGDLTINTGATLADGTYMLTGPGSGHIFAINGTGAFSIANTTVAYVFPAFQTYSFVSTSTVSYANAGANQQISPLPSPYGNLTLSGAAKNANGNFTIAGTITNTNGFVIGANTVTVHGLISGASAWTGGATSNLIFGGGGPATTLPTVTGGLNNLTINRASGINLSGAVTVAGVLDLQQGALNINAGVTLTLSGSVAYNGLGTGTLSGTSTSVLSIGGTTGGSLGTLNFSGSAPNLGTFTVNRTGTTPSVDLGTALTVQTALNLTSGVVNAGSGSLTIGIPATAFTTTRGLGSLSFVPNFNYTIGAYAITYNGASQTYNVLNELPPATTPTNGILTVSLATDNVILDKNANIGTLTTTIAGAIFNLNGNTLGLSLGTAMNNAGTLTANAAGSTIKLNGSIAQTFTAGGTITGAYIENLLVSNTGGFTAAMGGNISVDNLEISSGSIFSLGASYTLGILGTYTNNGTLTANGASCILEMKGASPQTLTVGTYTGSVVTNFKVSNTTGVTLNAPLNATTLTLAATAAGPVLNTTSGLMTIAGTTAANIVQTVATNYIVGPLARTFPASLITGSVFNFPIGKTASQLFTMNNPTTSAAGTLVVTAEVFDMNSGGTAGAGINTLNNNRFWQLGITGIGNFTGVSSIAITESGMTNGSSVIGQASSQTGTYQYKGGTVAGNIITSTGGINPTFGYFVIGTKATDICPGPFTIGPTGDFNSVADVAGVLNGTTVNCNLVFELQPAYVSSGESYPINFTNISYGGAYTVTVRPAAAVVTMLTTAGDPGTANPLINLNGADNIILDGRPGGLGSSIMWTIRNTRTAATIGPAIQFTAGANYNTLQYLQIEGSNQTLAGGVVYLYCSSSGPANNNITIQYCNIGPNGTTYPVNGIGAYAYSTTYPNSYISVLSNNIYNFQPTASTVGSGIFVYGTGTNTNYGDHWNISGNSIYNSVAQVNSYYVYPIYFMAGTGSNLNVISNNYIGGQSALCGGTGIPWVVKSTSSSGITIPAFAGMFIKAGSASITGNTISNIQINNTNQNGHAFGIDIDGTSGSNGFTITGNTIGNPNPTGSAVGFQNTGAAANGGTICGIINQAAGPITIGATGAGNGNIIANLSNVGSSVNTSVAGIVTNNGVNSIVNNTIFNLTAATQNTSAPVNSIPFDGSVVGILQASINSGQINISDNTIYNIISSGTAAAATRAVGINSTIAPYALPNTHYCDGNIIYNISAPNTNTSVIIAGIRLSGSSSSSAVNYTISNNMVRLGYRGDGSTITGSANLIGIFDNSSGYSGNPSTYDNNIRVYHNSVFIGGTGVTGGAVNTYAFFRNNTNSSPKNVEFIYNNIFNNSRSYSVSGTGFNAGIGLDNNLTYSPNLLSTDYNLVYGNGAQYRFGYITTTAYANKVAWNNANATFDANSISGDPMFMSPATTTPDLHIQLPPVNTPIESAGTSLYTTTYDIDGDVRASYTPVDLGADAGDFLPIDNTPPTITYTAVSSICNGTNMYPVSNVAISDGSGLNVNTGTRPRLYYKKLADASTTVDTVSGHTGWKFVEATGTVSPFSFNINFSKLNGGIPGAGESVQYFVIAQDASPQNNVGVNPGAVTITPSASSVDLQGSTVGGTPGSFANLPCSGTVSVGTGGTYPSFTTATGLFQALNQATLSGNVVVNVISDISIEDGANALNQWNESGTGGYTLTIQPVAGTSTPYVISGTYNGTGAAIAGLFRMNGADRVTIDGRNPANLPAGGKFLTFRNSDATASSNLNSTFTFINDAKNDAVQYCNIEGATVGTTNGVVLISTAATSGTGNTNILIDNCVVKNAGANNTTLLPTSGIVSAGTPTAGQENANITISNNNIYDFFNAGVSSSLSCGVRFTGGVTGNKSCTIAGNSIYETAARSFTTASLEWRGISVEQTSSNDFTISGNYIGGSAPQCGGSQMSLTSSSGISFNFVGIRLSLSASGTPASVQGNTIANVSFNSNSAGPTANAGINIVQGAANVGTVTGNTIGSMSSTNNISVTTTGGEFKGILSGSGGAAILDVRNNNIGGITLSGSASTLFRGIQIAGTTPTSLNISGNHIGSASVASSILNSSTAATTYGIYCTTGSATTNDILNNYIENMTVTNTSSSQQLIGIGIDAGKINISGNVIRKLRSDALNSSTGALACLIGICNISTTASQSIANNRIYALSTTSGSTAVNIIGIYEAINTATGTNLISGNYIHSFQPGNTSGVAVQYGIYNATGNASIVNNMIRLGRKPDGTQQSQTCTIAGIYDVSTAANPVLSNSVLIDAAVSGISATNTYAYWRNAASGADDIRNNIFANNSTGGPTGSKHFALVINSISTIAAFDNNIFQSNTGSDVFSINNGTTSLASLQALRAAFSTTAAQNLHSGVTTLSSIGFINAAGDTGAVNLHLNAVTCASGAGVTVSGITADIDGDTRQSPPDIGADEGAFNALIASNDIYSPVITYTAIGATQYLCGQVTTTSLTANITDVGTAVPVTGGNIPRIYYRRSSPSSTVWISTPGTLQSGNGNSCTWIFTIDYSLLSLIPASGETYQYYVVAQDQATNTVYPNLGSSKFDATTPVFTNNNVNTPVTHPSTPDAYVFAANTGLSGIINIDPSSQAGDVAGVNWFTSLTKFDGLFNKITTNGLAGDLDVRIRGAAITEDGNQPLNQWYEYCGSGYRMKISPASASVKTLSGNLGATGLFSISGADRVTIDGRFNGSGSYLKFENTYSGIGGSENDVFKFDNGCQYDTIRYCEIVGQTTKTGGGVIYFASGNSFISLDHNKIHGGAAWATNIVLSYAGGTANHDMTISNNEIYDFLYWSGGSANRSFGIDIRDGYNWTITGNSIFNTGINGQNTQTALRFQPGSSSTGNVISGNWIGGSSAQCGTGGSVTYWGNSWDDYYSGENQVIAIELNCGNVTVSNNNITNIYVSNADYSGFVGMKVLGSTIATISNNVFGTGSNGQPDNSKIIQVAGGSVGSGPGYIYGIWNTSTTTSMTTYDHNDFYYLWQSGANPGGNVHCIAHQGSGPATITNTNINGPQASGVSYNSFGIRLEPIASTSGNLIEHNTIAGPYINSAVNGGVVNSAIYVKVLGTQMVSGTISRNVVWDMRSAEKGGATEGIYVYTTSGGNGNWDIFNNQVTLKNNGNTTNCIGLYGIEVDLPSGSTTNVKYNTVYIGGSNGGSAVVGVDFSSYAYFRQPTSNPGDVITLQNNIFINNRLVGNGYVSGHFAIANTNGNDANWNTSNYNFLFTNNGTYNKIGLWGGTTAATLASWRTASGKDANSYSATVTTGASNFASGLLNPDVANYLFNDPLSDLHINIADGESYKFISDRGTPISITTDYDGNPRDAATPDIGADEFLSYACTAVSVASNPSAASVCTGVNNTSFTVTVSGTPNYYYQWQTSPNGTAWTNLANGGVYGTSAITSNTTSTSNSLSLTNVDNTYNNKQFRCVIQNCLNNNTVISNAATLTVSPASVGGTAAALVSSLCSGNSTSVSLSGNTGSIQWQTNASGTWQNISGATSSTYNTPALTVSTSFRAVVTSGSCSSAISSEAVVNITNIPSQPSIITGDTLPCRNSVQAYSVTNVSGVSYNWTFPADWTQAGGGTTNSVTLNVGQDSGYVMVTPSNSCGNGTSRSILVKPVIIGTWTGAVSANWNNPANWGCGVVPDTLTNVRVPQGVVNYPVVSSVSAAVCNNLLIDMNAGITVQASKDISVYGSLINNGTVTCPGSFIFKGSASAQINSPAGSPTYFSYLTINKTGSPAPVINVNTDVSITSSDPAALVLSRGDLRINTGGTISFVAGPVIGSAASMTINGGILSGGNYDVVNNGTFRVISGTANIGGVAGNVYYGSAGSLTRIDNGTMNIAGRMDIAGSGSQLTVHGGTLKLCTAGNSDPVYAGLEVSALSGLDITSGTVELQAAGSAPLDINIVNGAGTKSITGGILQFGNSSTDPATHFRMFNDAVAFNNVDMNNSVDVELFSPITINGGLTLTRGIILAAVPNTLTMNTAASWSGGSDSSFVAGTVDKIGDQAFVFPVGDIQGTVKVFAPVGISDPTASTDIFRAAYSFAPSIHNADLSYMTGNLDGTSAVEYWDVQRVAGTSQVYVSLYWKDTLRSNVTNPAAELVAHWNQSTSKWEDLGATFMPDAIGGHITATVASNNFSPFTLGSNKTFNTPLPVVLVEFNGECAGNAKVLTWKTASESNSDYFEVERSSDGKVWEYTGRVEAAGNSTNVNSYNFADMNPVEGAEYYRLKQADYDGKFQYFGPVVLSCSDVKVPGIEVFPNPFKDAFMCTWSNMKGNVIIHVYNEAGALVAEKLIDNAEQIRFIDFNFSKLSAGMYNLEFINAGRTEYRKLVKN